MMSQGMRFISGILCIHSLIVNIPILHSSSNVTKLEQNEVLINRCENWQYPCKNGKCIAEQFICDGLKDCKDESDESYDQCQNKSSMKCDDLHFQCKYGACIEKKYQCDGLKQCADGSDESPHICNVITIISDDHNRDRIRIRRDADNSKSCAVVPESSVDKTITFVCNANPSNVCTSSNNYFPELTVATVNCTADYYREDNNRSSVHFCYYKQWSPPITKCLKKCDQLNPINVDLECYRGGLNIGNCDENSLLLAGTKVYPSCRSSYKYDRPPTYYDITCNDEGRWNNILLPCVPECGKPYTSAKALISGGKPEKIGGAPWHTAIFEKKTELLICGGTIISENLVVSAAHCFSKENCNGTTCTVDNCEGIHCVDDYEVVVGKYTNNYAVIDNSYQRVMKIKEIQLPKSGYHGIQTYHRADIAILILTDRIPISPVILPACLNWDDLKNEKTPLDGAPGKVVGWGRTENGTLSTILRTVDLPFMNSKRCLEVIDDDFKSFLTFDKFCAGTGNRTGATLMDGDSGGGIMFEEKGLFYLWGVVSVKQYSSNSVTMFTDLSKHVNWLISVHDNVETHSQIGQNQIQSSKSPDRNRIHQVVYNTNIYSNQEEAKRQLVPEIVNDIKSQRFRAAEQKLGVIQQDDDDVYYLIVHEVYNNQTINFDLLLNFANSIRNIGYKLRIFECLLNETESSGHTDPQKLIQMGESLSKVVLDPSFQRFSELKLIKNWKHALTKAAIEPISSAFLNNTDEELGSNICAICYDCLGDIYRSVVEIVWNKIPLEHFLRKVLTKQGYLAENIPVHLAVVDKLERIGGLNTRLAIILDKYINITMSFPNYSSIHSYLRLIHEEAKNKLLKSVNRSTIGSNDETKPQKEVDHLLTSGIKDDIKSHRFSTAELKLSQMDPSTYLNIVHEVYHNHSDGFNLLLTFGDFIGDTGNKFKIYEFLYNETARDGLDNLQKLFRLVQSVKKMANSSTSPLAALKLYQNLKKSIIKLAVEPISSAFQDDKSWPLVRRLIGNISAVCYECTEKIYGPVLETVWDTITLEQLLRTTNENIRNITEVVTVYLTMVDKLELTGTLNTSSAKTLANYIDSTMTSPLYHDINPYLRLRYEEAKMKLLQPANKNKDEVEIKIQQDDNRQLLTEIIHDIKTHQFSTVEKKLSQMDPNVYLNISHEIYNNQASRFDLLLSFGHSISDVKNKFKIYEFLYNKTAPSDHNYASKLLRLSEFVKKEILDQSTEPPAVQVQEFHRTLKSTLVKAAVETISSAFQNGNLWPMVNELSRNISNNCWDCTVMIYKSVVETVWDSVTLDDFLRKTDKNIVDLAAVIAVHVAVTDKLERIQTLHSISSIILARYMKSTMDSSNYRKLKSDQQSQHKSAKNKLPLSVKNLVFSSAICIKNTQYKEYLHAATSSNVIYRSDEHGVYTWISGDRNKPPKSKWYVSFWGSHQIQLRDDHFREYLFVGSKTYDNSRRFVSTWNTNTPNENVAWDVEVHRDSIFIKDNFYNEYLFADYAIKENQTRRYVFTYRHEGRTSDSEWQIDDCSY